MDETGSNPRINQKQNFNTMDTINYKGYAIEVTPDEWAENPRTAWDNLGTMVCFHSRYKLGDKHNFSDGEELMNHIKETNAIALPLYLYDHSGITISTSSFSCHWDSGMIGMIFITREDILKEFGGKRITPKLKAKVIELLTGEVETFDQFITGEVYQYAIKNHEGGIIDSCSGFYGDNHETSGLLEHAKPSIDYYIKEQYTKHFKQLKTWIANKVPLMYRKPLQLA